MIICSTSNIDLIHGQDVEGYGKIDGITDWRITNIPSITPGQTGIFSIFNSVTPTIPSISILETGTVGIGTIPSNSSTSKMEIIGSVNITGSYMTVANNATSSTILSISNNCTPTLGTPSIELIRGITGDNNMKYKIGNYNGDFKVISSIYNTDSESFVINSSANVGIGTTNPLKKLHLFDNSTNNTSLVIQNNSITVTGSSAPTINPNNVLGGTFSTGQISGSIDRFMIFTAGTSSFPVPAGGLNCDILMIGSGGSSWNGGSGAGACIIAVNQTFPEGTCTVVVGASVGGQTQVNGQDSSISVAGTVRYLAKGGGFVSGIANTKGGDGGCGGGASPWSTGNGTAASGGIAVGTNIVNAIPNIGVSITSTYAVLGNAGGGNGGINGAAGGGGGIEPNVSSGAGSSATSTAAGKGGDGAYQVTLNTSPPRTLNFRTYFANDGTFGVENGTTGNYYIGGGGGGLGAGGSQGNGGLGGGGGVNRAGVANTGSGGSTSGASGSGIVIIRYRINETSLGNPSIELIRGNSSDTNTDYKIGNYSGDFKIMSSVSNTDTERVIINSTGNVGIGTTNPGNILQVGNSSRLRISNGASDYTRIGTNDVLGTTNTRINIYGNTSASNPGQIDYYATSTGHHVFYTTDSNTESMRITNTGNVGIGTTNPTSKLHVNGTINGTFSGNGASITSLNAGNISDGTLAVARGGTGRASFNDNQILVGSLTQSGNLTWDGNTFYANGNSGSKFVLRGSSPTIYLRDTDNRSGMIHMNGNLMHFLNGNGNDTETWATQNGQSWALTLDMNNNNAAFGGNVSANYYSGNGGGLSSLNAGYISDGTLAVARGGTGRTSFNDNQILVGSLTQSGNLTWNGSTFYVNGIIQSANYLYIASDIYATGNITAYYSDERLKTKISNIKDPLEIINKLNGFYYTPNELARKNGIKNTSIEIGLSAQEVQKVLPEIVKIAPFDSERNKDDVIVSKSGENYLTLSYERLIPVFVEAIKELERKNIELTREIALIKEKIK
jgi:hypothetical protein